MTVEATAVSIFGKTLQKSSQWVSQVRKETPGLSDEKAFHVLKAVLQTLRDHLLVDEGAHFAAQLPMLLRGAFYEGWDPSQHSTRLRKPDDFIHDVLERLHLKGEPSYDVERAIVASLGIIGEHVSEGEMDDVVHCFPEKVRSLF